MKEEEKKTKKKVTSTTKRIVAHKIFCKLEVKIVKVGIDATY